MPPSPVLCRQPACAAPRFRASMARALSEPKLMAETLTTESGRKARGRPWAAPSTLAAGNGTDGSARRSSSGLGGAGNATCLRIT